MQSLVMVYFIICQFMTFTPAKIAKTNIVIIEYHEVDEVKARQQIEDEKAKAHLQTLRDAIQAP